MSPAPSAILLRDIWLGGLLLASAREAVPGFDDEACARALAVCLGEPTPPEWLGAAAAEAPPWQADEVVHVSARCLLRTTADAEHRAWKRAWAAAASGRREAGAWRRDLDRHVLAVKGEQAIGLPQTYALGLRTVHLELLGSTTPEVAREALRQAIHRRSGPPPAPRLAKAIEALSAETSLDSPQSTRDGRRQDCLATRGGLAARRLRTVA